MFAERKCIAVTPINYESGATVSPHCHSEGQLIYARSGIMDIESEGKLWRVPPQRAVWMPPRQEHGMKASSAVELRTVYIPYEKCSEDVFKSPRLIAVSSLLRELILRGIHYPAAEPGKGLNGRIVNLILDELVILIEESRSFSERSLSLPSGNDKPLRKVCEAILEYPGHPHGLEEWAKVVGASKRTLSRRFQAEFGTSFVNWRQQVRVVAAQARLDKGDPVTVIAGDLGYETPAAFSLMFRRATGLTPSQYVNATRAHISDEEHFDVSGGDARSQSWIKSGQTVPPHARPLHSDLQTTASA
jgi:AraC-like DNA-binding protein